MLTMAACFPTYGADTVNERSKELWEGIKTEILYSSDSTIEVAALSALESLMRTLYPNEDSVPSGLAQEIIQECMKSLEEPDKNQALGSTKIIAAIFRSSREYTHLCDFLTKNRLQRRPVNSPSRRYSLSFSEHSTAPLYPLSALLSSQLSLQFFSLVNQPTTLPPGHMSKSKAWNLIEEIFWIC